jgi:hypothetical protein
LRTATAVLAGELPSWQGQAVDTALILLGKEFDAVTEAIAAAEADSLRRHREYEARRMPKPEACRALQSDASIGLETSVTNHGVLDVFYNEWYVNKLRTLPDEISRLGYVDDPAVLPSGVKCLFDHGDPSHGQSAGG